MVQPRLGGLLIVAMLLSGGPFCTAEPETAPEDELANGFTAIPHESKPWVYWWFEGGYGNPEGMARDIAEMKEKGIGGVMHMQTINAGGLPIPKEPKMLSPEWDAWFGEMLRVGHHAGMSLSASILDGWSHGGWWVGKEDGAKQLVYSEIQVDGPVEFQAPLPQPLTRLDVYRDVAVVAFKEKTPRTPVPLRVSANNVKNGYCGEENWPAIHAVDGDPETFWRTQSPCSSEVPAVLELFFPQPVHALSAIIIGMPNAGPEEGELLFSGNGKEFKKICSFTMHPGENKELNFDTKSGSYYRLVVNKAHALDLQLAEFQLLRSGDKPFIRPGIKWWDFKSANRAWWEWPPNPYEALEDEYTGQSTGDIPVSDVLDLTAQLEQDGTLKWQVPDGRWTVIRYGWTPLAEPARMGSGGYEIDVLNVKGADLMMETVAKRMRALSETYAEGSPVLYHTDSWEIGAGGKGQQPTWTEDFREQFQERRGYDLLQYLPALARRVVDDRETTNRFLRDYRDTVADLLADYYKRLQERAREFSSGVNSESGYGSYPHPHMDGLKIFSYSDRPMAEFWHPFGQYKSEYLQHVDIMRTAASAARIYGNRFVQAETLTFHPTEGLFIPPSQYRRTLHEAWARGLNQTVIHKYTHQPFEEKPGLLDYDIFNRHFSWWPLADGLIGYMGRCQYLLQQGDFAADYLYFVGEGATRFVPGRDYLNPGLPQGYDYDGINAEVLLTRISVKDGKLQLPACESGPGVQPGKGMQYQYLVLCEPQCRTMSPKVLEKIRDLVISGATLIGQPPQNAPGLKDRVAADAEVRGLRTELWGDIFAHQGERKVGLGRVFWGNRLEDILEKDGVKPDVELSLDSRIRNRAGLADACWIWHSNDPQYPPPCERLFCSFIEIPGGRNVTDAQVSITADNEFVFSINGKEIVRGSDFQHVFDADISKSLFRNGKNDILVHVKNRGSDSNPAGLICKVVITLDNGVQINCKTDMESWKSSEDGRQWIKAGFIGPIGCDPWGQVDSTTTDSENIAWIHRCTHDSDIYFLANPNDTKLRSKVTLRAKGNKARLFDPLDGSIVDLQDKMYESDDRKTIDLVFEPEQSLFVVLSDGPDSTKKGPNSHKLEPVMIIEGPWQVTFDANWVHPLPVDWKKERKDLILTFNQLKDWVQHSEEGVQGYSGVADYLTHFNLSHVNPGHQLFIDLGIVKEMARVIINDIDLGVVWCPPWRVRIPEDCLKEIDNELRLIVANTWNNRLYKDNSLPEKERLTRVGHDLYNTTAKKGLESSGLLGPVTIMIESD